MPAKRPIKERFWEKVPKGDDNQCWEWRACRNRQGYGQIWDGSMRFAHRVMYEFAYQVKLGDECVLHSCDNPPCVNPRHLRLGTRGENNQDRNRKLRTATGERCGAAKLTGKDVKHIRVLLHEGYTCTYIAKLFNVSRTSISSIHHGRTWGAV
jgi:hypothetical protein